MKVKVKFCLKEQKHKKRKNSERRLKGKMNKCIEKLFTATVRNTLKQFKEQKPLKMNDAVKIAQKATHLNFKGKKRANIIIPYTYNENCRISFTY